MGNILSSFLHIVKLKDLRNKIFFVLGVMMIFRLMANIPIPGIDATKLQQFFEGNQLLGLLNLFTGGALDNLSIAMLGLGPYITGVIVVQLLTMVFPALEKMYKEDGEAGRKKFNQYGRLLTVPFALLQGYSFLALLSNQGIITLTPSVYITALSVMTAGTILLMWLGELITEKGIGNGVSLLIFAGIVSGVPASLREMLISYDPSKLVSYVVFFAMAMVIIAGVVFITEARRNIQVSYAKRVRGNKVYGGSSTYLPLQINPAGVIPIIFALSLLTFPGMIASFFAGSGGVLGTIANSIQGFLMPTSISYGVMYFLLVVVFTFFYTAVTFDPKAISTNLQKMGGFIPGVRPGVPTAQFLSFTLNRILIIGALFLGFIAILPSIIQGVTSIGAFGFLMGGTALLIVVSVVLETVRQMKAQIQMREYDSF